MALSAPLGYTVPEENGQFCYKVDMNYRVRVINLFFYAIGTSVMAES